MEQSAGFALDLNTFSVDWVLLLHHITVLQKTITVNVPCPQVHEIANKPKHCSQCKQNRNKPEKNMAVDEEVESKTIFIDLYSDYK